MDAAFNQHSDRARRKNRSFANINHLSLAPLTVKLPVEEPEDIVDSSVTPNHQSISYLQGKSAPTTPRLLSHSPAGTRSRSHHRTGSAPGIPITKSKSSSHLAATKQLRSGASTPRRRKDDTLDRSDSDWLSRVGAMISSETRESKGQNWLVSRQSSTSLTGMRDADEEAFQAELAREREMASRRASRRGSAAVGSEASPPRSRRQSRQGSRSHSMATGVRSRMMTPGDKTQLSHDSYFPDEGEGEQVSGPDFVNLDAKLERLGQDEEQDDEDTVRRLVRSGQTGRDSWLASMVGWSLFSVDENGEESEDDDGEEGSVDDKSTATGRSSWSVRHFEGVSNAPEERMPPPTDEGGWKDAAWLLSVASKVML